MRTNNKKPAQTDRVTQYAKEVCQGKICAGPHVRNTCRRHLDDLKKGRDRGLIFDRETAAWAISYFEDELKLSEGQFDGKPFILDESQAFIIGSIFGWLRIDDGRRRFRRAFIEQGKGNGKSPLVAGIGLLGLLADGEAGAQIYSAAAKREQAAILFLDAVAMVKKSPRLQKRVKVHGAAGKEYNISHPLSGSFFRPVSRDHGKSGSGPRPYFILADEIHEMPNRTVLEILERGFKFRRQPLLVMITNSGTDRNSIAYEEHEHAIRVAAGSPDPVGPEAEYVGEAIDDTTFSYVCALDPEDDPLTDPSCWIKANPLLGKTITESYLSDIVKQAVAMPGKLNNILRLHFCVWTDADVAWMNRKTVQSAMADFDPHQEHSGKSVAVGMDLSQSRDITALACVVETGTVEIVSTNEDGTEVRLLKPTYDAWVEAWTPGDTIAARELRDKLPYQAWINAGHIHAPPGASIPYLHVAQALSDIDRHFGISICAYDKYAFAKFEEDAGSIGLSISFVEHPQGGVKKGKVTEAMRAAAENADPPREAQGLWMPGSVRLLENALLEGRLRLKENPVLMSAMLSAVPETDKWGNHWLSKQRSVNKIDAAVALAMAMGAADLKIDPDGGLGSWLKSEKG